MIKKTNSMKFKYGDRVKFKDEFYGEGIGIIKKRILASGGYYFEYLIVVISGKSKGNAFWITEHLLEKIK